MLEEKEDWATKPSEFWLWSAQKYYNGQTRSKLAGFNMSYITTIQSVDTKKNKEELEIVVTGATNNNS